ncbi:class I SAM-dependent methyltransferase [Dietzia sp. PP-33]|uniref:class I SAM-dependent methyltransferase n=1 Tax=Dietzia sp. PP-33 TaxID=2957500 RepID=UPI0029AF3EF9|nr:class I SAM-dependent methyltransferase [Dietzia sp. PP-33]MDX2358766.1 class I SAM-dependent methyltransferase [Dietzia sp. PP-33]
MFTALRRSITQAPINTSRYYLRQWAQEAASLGDGEQHRVLDVGAGDAPYRSLFSHVTYETADLHVYQKQYSELDHVCDITNMPMPDNTYDQVFCSQTLEHVREPVQALREIARVLKPGGTAWLTAPFFYEEHEKPYDFFRYTSFGWEHMAETAGLVVHEIDWLEGYFGTVSYQLNMAARSLPSNFIIRFVLLILSRHFAKADIRQRVTDRGMCKNFRVVLGKPHPEAVNA